uniref:Guanine deaminase n=1 Tax=uncultured Thiotrichaceae bacterium TaxID=298394 RepID=A0A6S6UJG9_9GAMM|nr:MAG: Guanine deaminase (EC [uncultured Thiotrichaceae bacterium]
MQNTASSHTTPKAFRASILHLLGDPGEDLNSAQIEYWDDGLLLIKDGHIVTVGDAETLLPKLPAGCELNEYPDHLIIPGMIDTHVHYPQTDMIAAYGSQLLEWLETYTFPTEQQFSDPEHAKEVATFFLNELLRNGTTTALVFGTVHPESVDSFFHVAEQLNLRMIAGKVLMDRNCPEYLQDTPDQGYQESKTLIEKWHGKGRLAYAVTPRFAPTSSSEQLNKAAQLLDEHPDVYMHTHLAENPDEVNWVEKLFPQSRSYLDVYHQHHLLRPRSVLAHCIHLDDDDKQCMSETGSAAAFCPTSNLFLGSGLFDLEGFRKQGIRVGMGTDIGGGTSFNMLKTGSEAYKVTQLRGKKLSAFQALYLATLSGAKALYLDDKIGNFKTGKEADFVVLNFKGTPLIERRMQHTKTLHEKLFALIMLGDDRSISATYILGNQTFKQ